MIGCSNDDVAHGDKHRVLYTPIEGSCTSYFYDAWSTCISTVPPSYQVRGFCVDKSNHEVFEDVNVYGNIYDSDIHHNNFGVYTYGHQQGDWRRNKMHDNHGYGFDPHDDSDFLSIHDNEVYNNGYHGIIESKRCNGVSIQVRVG